MGPILIRSKPLLVLLFYLMVSVFVIPFVGMSLPYSVYYHSESESDQQQVKRDNDKRARDAEVALKDFGKYLLRQNRTVADPKFCFVIPSVSRPNNVRYLTQVVVALLPQIAATDSVFMVLNAEGPKHVEAMQLMPLVHVQTSSIKQYRSVMMKEKDDYIQGLEWCLKQRAKFSVMVEDDVLSPSDFMQRLEFVLHYRMPSDGRRWAFLKLYYPEKWEGWAAEWRIMIELFVTTLFGGMVLTSLVFLFQFVLIRTLPHKLEGFIVLFFSSIFMVYMLIALGRQHWLSLRSVSPHFISVVPSPGCCTPAVVYPNAQLADLIDYLRNSESSQTMPIDLALDKFAGERGLEHLLVVPNMVKHIGFVSSLGKHGNRPKDFRLW